MAISNWNLLNRQMQQWDSLLVSAVKIPKNKTDKIAFLIAEEINKIPIESKKEIIHSISRPISIQDRLDELRAFQGWMEIANDLLRNPCITRAQVIVQNYICFVYLGDSCFKNLKKYLETGSITKKCCNFLINNPVRAFRNALSHSNWKYNDDFTGIIFYARKGHEESEPMEEWQVLQEDLAFWQALARCTGYTVLSCLKL